MIRLMHRETYPPYQNGKDPELYFVEFLQWEGQPMSWQLFKRQIMHTQAEIDKAKAEGDEGWVFMMMQREGHPWNLGEGIISSYENVISMHTKEFLKFMVDAMNEKVQCEA